MSDPYKFTTPEVEREMIHASNAKVAKLLIGTTLAQLLTAPFQTIVTSLQLSVLPHKDIYISAEARTK